LIGVKKIPDKAVGVLQEGFTVIVVPDYFVFIDDYVGRELVTENMTELVSFFDAFDDAVIIFYETIGITVQLNTIQIRDIALSFFKNPSGMNIDRF
jgi:hypothetical protein